ncbi:16S rRNA (guanine(966)-N(2))-methyltransferase RsmD [Mycoplasmopsis columbina]|uniref:16S rRNA (guanine(966)-N(2))-methyltransferase RsmD n=1 Tax=Mycoplasmopsis columbina TaxID=114881 RepID=UPI0021605260|nr:16S rRNA (guanine(966)-N(2))-methyltransferase RsmD [Mycoplasmopsis columbina]
MRKEGVKMLRIISGIHRSRLLEQPEENITRPTMDRIREAIFNSIRFKIKDAIVLDLFAGSGAFSFEAISNGAMKAIAVDNSFAATKVIEKNQNSLNVSNLEIYKQDVLAFLNNNGGKKFDFIFIDPPYKNYELINEILKTILHKEYLTKNGLIIVETNNSNLITIPEGLTVQNNKKYGKVEIIFVSNNN